MAHRELDEAAISRIRSRCEYADKQALLETEPLAANLKSTSKPVEARREFESVLRESWVRWARSVFCAVLAEWASIGIPSEDFDLLISDQIESLSQGAFSKCQSLIINFDLSSGLANGACQ